MASFGFRTVALAVTAIVPRENRGLRRRSGSGVSAYCGLLKRVILVLMWMPGFPAGLVRVLLVWRPAPVHGKVVRFAEVNLVPAGPPLVVVVVLLV